MEKDSFTRIFPSKNHNEENFPVASMLIKKDLRPHIHTFYRCVREADDIADHTEMSSQEKIRRLKIFDDVLAEKNHDPLAAPKAYAHLQSVKKTGVQTEHARNLLQAFMLDVKKTRYRNWSELINYCRFSAAPVGRYLLELHGENKMIRQQTDALCIALQILNHLQDCKQDYLNLNRVYIPEDFLRAEGLQIDEFAKSSSSTSMRKVFNNILQRTSELLNNTSGLSRSIVNRGLRMETAVIVAIAHLLLKKLSVADPIVKPIKLSKFQTIYCVTRGIIFN